MSKLVSLFVLLFLFVGLGNVWGQELTEEEKQEIEEKYYGNQDYWQGSSLLANNKDKEAREWLRKSMADFNIKQNWKAYSLACAKLVRTYSGSPDYEDGITIAQVAIQNIRQNNKRDTFQNYPIHHSLTKIYYDLPNYEEAVFQAKKTIELLNIDSSKVKNYNINSCYANNYLGLAYLGLGNLENAEKYLTITKEFALTDDTDDHKLMRSYAYSNLGMINHIKSNYRKACDLYEKGLNAGIDLKGENSLELVNSYKLLFILYTTLTQFDKSLEYGKKINFIIEDSGVDNSLFFNHRFDVLESMIHTFLEINDTEQAEFYYKILIELAEKQEIKESKLLRLEIKKVKILIKKGAYNEAKTELGKIKEKKLIYKDEGFEADLISMGLIHDLEMELCIKLGDFECAKQAQVEDLKTIAPYSNSISNDLAFDYFSLAEICKNLMQYDSAIYYNHLGLKATAINFDSDTFDSFPISKNIQPRLQSYDLLVQKASLLHKKALFSNNSTKLRYLKTALKAIQLIDSTHNHNLKQINLLTGGDNSGFVDKAITAYRIGLGLINNLQKIESSSEYIELSFNFSERMKSQQLLSKMMKNEAILATNLNQSIITEEMDLIANINFYEKEVLYAQNEGDIETAELIQNQQLFSLKNKYVQLQKELELQHREYFEIKYNFKPENTASLKSLLHQNDLIIEYVLHDSLLYLFTIEADKSPTLKCVQLSDNIFDQTRTYHTILANSTMNRPSSREKFINLSHQLYQQFLQPIEDQLAGKKRIIIIGDGMTNYIPFETLLSSNEVKPFKDLDFLIKNHEISYHYSSTLFAKAKRKEQSTNEGIYAFAPVYDDEDGLSFSTDATRSIQIDSTLRAFDLGGNYTPLPESETEVNSILQLFDKKSKSTTNTLALRDNANEENLKMNLEKPYQFVHIAGHSFADLNNPKFSGIACFKEENQDSTMLTNDGTLFTGEIYNISSQADLVTLSSCESGFGKLEKTEGLLGLNRAFIYAGTPNVVFSLWKVYDKVSANLMVDFYKNVLDGEDYAASLRQAKLKLLENEATATPHFWSPFLLIGR